MADAGGLLLSIRITYSTFQGRIFRDLTFPNLHPSERRGLYIAMVTTLAQLHSIDWQAIGLDYKSPGSVSKGNYCKRQVCEWLAAT